MREFVGVMFDPHQLDFDWRFSSTSIHAIGEHTLPCQNILLIGCPSLMEQAESRISFGMLIERNPYHHGRPKFKLLRTDVRYHQRRLRFSNLFDATVFDSPWYPDEFLRWASLALSYTKIGGSIFFVLWPVDVRPTGQQEHKRIFDQLERVGSIEHLGIVSYEIPPFEMASLRERTPDANFTREGLFYRLTKQSDSPLPPISFRESQIIWKRYRFGPHQLALRINPNERHRKRRDLFEVEPFVLSNTSRRNSDLSNINAWVSNNVAARVRDPHYLDAQIMKMKLGSKSHSASSFLENMGLVADSEAFQWGQTWLHRA
jgi:hypothetical protein